MKPKDNQSKSKTTTERNVSITNKTVAKDTLNSRDSSAKDKQDRSKDLSKKSKGSDLKPEHQNVAFERAHTPTKSNHNQKRNENTIKHQNTTNLKQEKDKHKATKEEHQEQHNATKPAQVSTTTPINKDAKENSKDNTKKTRRTTTNKSKGNYMARMINLAWKSLRRTTKEGKKAEDRRKGGAEQEATNETRDNRDRTRSAGTTELINKEEDNEEWTTKTEEPPTLEPSYEETGMYEQVEEREVHDNTEPPTQESSQEVTGTSADTEAEAKEENQTENTQNHIPRSNYGIFVDALYKHLEKEPKEYELFLNRNMDETEQDEIEGALTKYHKDLWGKEYMGKPNEEKTLTNWRHYVDVIWKLLYTLPGYDERELYRNYIRGLPREESEDAVKRLHQDLKEWDTKKLKDATPEQERAMGKAWLQRKRDMEEEKQRPLEEEGEHITYPQSGMTKYMNIMRELNAVKTEREEEEREGGETYDGKKIEGEGKEEGGKKEGEERKDSEEAEGTGKDDGKDKKNDDRGEKEEGEDVAEANGEQT
jgi:hypothetical protein